MNKKAFTFVELLMVMIILGIIASLTVPLIRKLVNNQEINRSYLKKAYTDVTDGYNLISMATRNFTALNCEGLPDNDCAKTFDDDNNLRTVFQKAFAGPTCKNGCKSNMSSTLPGIFAGNKMITLYEVHTPTTDDPSIGRLYYDINGNKAPNKYCSDQFKFFIYPDRIAIDGVDIGAYVATCKKCADLAKKD